MVFIRFIAGCWRLTVDSLCHLQVEYRHAARRSGGYVEFLPLLWPAAVVGALAVYFARKQGDGSACHSRPVDARHF